MDENLQRQYHKESGHITTQSATEPGREEDSGSEVKSARLTAQVQRTNTVLVLLACLDSRLLEPHGAATVGLENPNGTPKWPYP